MTRQGADSLNVKIPAARLGLRKNFFSCPYMRKMEQSAKGDKKIVRMSKARRHMGTHPSQAMDEPGRVERDEIIRDIPLGALIGPRGIMTQDLKRLLHCYLEVCGRDVPHREQALVEDWRVRF